MTFIKMLHVLFIFIWIGNLLTLTRFLGYLAKEELNVQKRLIFICRRMHLFVGLPSMLLAIILGLILLVPIKFGPSMGWFHMKMTFTLGLIICTFICGRLIHLIYHRDYQIKPAKAKILHAVTALMLIGTLSSIYIVRNKEAEIRNRFLEELSTLPPSAT